MAEICITSGIDIRAEEAASGAFAQQNAERVAIDLRSC